jgi:ATP-dependent Clp protease ATP-binding subunit ClpA
MFTRYTQRAQHVIVLAQQEARRQGMAHVAPVHLLAAVLREGSGLGACTLKGLGLELASLQPAIDRVTGVTPPEVPARTPAELPYSPAAKTIMVETAVQRSRQLGHNYVGTEHILLALLDDEQVQKVLDATGVTLEQVRSELQQVLQLPTSQPSAATQLHSSLQELLTGARQTAVQMGHKIVRPEHILLAVLRDENPGPLARFLTERGITAEAVQQHMEQYN